MLIAFPHRPGSGGPGSFQTRFEAALRSRGWRVDYASSDRTTAPDAILVVGGTRKLPWLSTMKRRGVPIIYRLGGLLWLHRVSGFASGPSRWIGSEVRNVMAQVIHSRLADSVIYQSDFVRDWWLDKGWREPSVSSVIPNGIDLGEFHPGKETDIRGDLPEVVCVEGHLDYSPYAVELLNKMAGYLRGIGSRLVVYGGLDDVSKAESLDSTVDYRGSVKRADVAGVLRNRIFLSLDINPACPNSIAEALASGAPVMGFDTGAVKELVGTEAGVIIPYGGDPWAGNLPQIDALPAAYHAIANDFSGYSARARDRAVERFGLDRMVDSYEAALKQAIEKI